MRAAILKGRGLIELDRSYPEPPCGISDIRLRVIFSGICGSDLHEFVAGPFLMPMPVVLGHEFCGEVVELGADVRGFDPGDKAVGVVYPSCGRCSYCRQGDFALCDLRAMAISERNGSFAEYVVAPARQLFLAPALLPADEAALIEPAAVACHAIRRARMMVGERVVVLGAGPIGLLLVRLARLAGAASVVVIEPTPGRRRRALDLGADLALAPDEEVEGPLMELTESRGADLVFEVSGTAAGFSQAQRLVRKQGRLILVALYPERRLELDASRAMQGEVDLVTSYWANDIDFRLALELVGSRKLDVRPLISDRVPLEGVQQAFARLAADRGNDAKVLVSCA